ncbi:MAG: hypothetical protein LC115_05610 [Bacteroidia bacterium]|nr:hypothetical protein [Bacteroidia bacterium]
MTNIHNRFFICITFVVVLLNSCKHSGSDVQMPEVVQEKVPEAPINFKRADLELRKAYVLHQQQPKLSNREIYNQIFLPDKYFYIDWLYGGDSLLSDSIIAQDLVGFSLDIHTQQLIDSVLKFYPENHDFVSGIQSAMNRLRQHIPDAIIPRFRTYISGYSMPGTQTMDQLHLSEQYAGIGLHYFLGDSFKFYPSDIPKFVRKKCKPEMILPNLFFSYIGFYQKELSMKKSPSLLDEMIYYGIKYYFLDIVLPDVPDSVKIGYTAEQMDWAQHFPKEIYNDLIPMLYSKDFLKYEKYVRERPFTPNVSRDSPGRLGHYVGWQIIRSYMKNNPKTTLTDLLTAQNYEQLFKNSGYKP